MKKVKIISLLLALAMAFSLCACSSEETTEQKESVQFGTFGYNGAVLTDYAVSAITAEKAKEILQKAMQSAADLKVPLQVDIGIGKSWFIAKN